MYGGLGPVGGLVWLWIWWGCGLGFAGWFGFGIVASSYLLGGRRVDWWFRLVALE